MVSFNPSLCLPSTSLQLPTRSDSVQSLSSVSSSSSQSEVLRPSLRSLQDDVGILSVCLNRWDELIGQNRLVSSLAQDGELVRFFQFEDRIHRIQTETSLTGYEVVRLNSSIKFIPVLVNEFLEKLKEEIEFHFDLAAKLGRVKMLVRNDHMFQLLEKCYSSTGILNPNFASISWKEKDFDKASGFYCGEKTVEFFRPNRRTVMEVKESVQLWLAAFQQGVIRQRKLEERNKATALANNKASKNVVSEQFQHFRGRTSDYQTQEYPVLSSLSSEESFREKPEFKRGVSIQHETAHTRTRGGPVVIEESKKGVEQPLLVKNLQVTSQVDTPMTSKTTLLQQIQNLTSLIKLTQKKVNKLSSRNCHLYESNSVFIYIFSREFILRMRELDAVCVESDSEEYAVYVKQRSGLDKDYSTLLNSYERVFNEFIAYLYDHVKDPTVLSQSRNVYLFLKKICHQIKSMSFSSELILIEKDLNRHISIQFEGFQKIQGGFISAHWESVDLT